jgi:hypothetical protein
MFILHPKTTHGCSFDLSSNAHWIHYRSRSQSVSPVNVWWGTVFWICGSAWNRVCASGLSLALKKGALEVHPSQKRHEKTWKDMKRQGISRIIKELSPCFKCLRSLTLVSRSTEAGIGLLCQKVGGHARLEQIILPIQRFFCDCSAFSYAQLHN